MLLTEYHGKGGNECDLCPACGTISSRILQITSTYYQYAPSPSYLECKVAGGECAGRGVVVKDRRGLQDSRIT